MNSQQQTWYRAGGDMIARSGFSLAMCGALAGVLYMTANDGSEELAASAGGTAAAATVVTSFEASPGLYKSQAVVDASPATMSAPAKTPVPVERVAQATRAPARRAASPVKRPASEPVAIASNVVRFESCLPGCDTRDPRVLGYVVKASDPSVSPGPADELVAKVSFTERTPSILERAMHAPGFVYRQGRSALTTLVRAAL
jgi:hypothetical protein